MILLYISDIITMLHEEYIDCISIRGVDPSSSSSSSSSSGSGVVV